jgi:hypothetical protein
MIISMPVQTAVWETRADGALLLPVGVQLFTLGSYLPPVFKPPELNPPQTIISMPVHTAVCEDRALGALAVLVVVQLFMLGSYLPPVFAKLDSPYPPQTII